ncbi:Hypothetical protein GSB_152802 [Giardia duodenalis]|uniref:Uncharacterized protein n=2 Tax=Giardia intestinalis TaxID=5741 RepID=C6LQ57_GIAIB|nr:Hypothetical protein GL50581_879 [Giardia intestinalis ATCC 50581]ESU43208.1 Hypothetical protein GSB_152802 [Giardia intestinalis]
MRARRPPLSPLVGISRVQAPSLGTIEEENRAQLCPLVSVSQAPASTIAPGTIGNEKSAAYYTATGLFGNADKRPNNMHPKTGSTDEVNGMESAVIEKRPDESDESVILHMFDHEPQPGEQAVSIGWTISPVSFNDSLCVAEAYSKSHLEESPLSRAAAVQEMNKAIILDPLLHRRPVRSAELLNGCLRGEAASRLHRFHKLSTSIDATPTVYTSDTSDDLSWV